MKTKKGELPWICRNSQPVPIEIWNNVTDSFPFSCAVEARGIEPRKKRSYIAGHSKAYQTRVPHREKSALQSRNPAVDFSLGKTKTNSPREFTQQTSILQGATRQWNHTRRRRRTKKEKNSTDERNPTEKSRTRSIVFWLRAKGFRKKKK